MNRKSKQDFINNQHKIIIFFNFTSDNRHRIWEVTSLATRQAAFQIQINCLNSVEAKQELVAIPC